VKLLEKLGYIEWVETRRVRGAKEHFFRGRQTLFLDDHALGALPRHLKSDIAVDFLQSILDEAAGALEGGTFHRRPNSHVSWTPATLDSQGWNEAMLLLERALERFMEIQRECAQRILRTGEPGIPMTFGLVGFETAPGPSILNGRQR